ncbi:hypothetical protein WMY93_004497 [Mugilogobius chulae]|uniref:Uncharacterized protein n=1 Tax=Mugilogobius chulae TaxID=88201 RepID=A0AAW0PS85_9GOBI
MEAEETLGQNLRIANLESTQLSSLSRFRTLQSGILSPVHVPHPVQPDPVPEPGARSTGAGKLKQQDVARAASTSSSRRRLLKEAVYRRSGGSSRPDTASRLLGALPLQFTPWAGQSCPLRSCSLLLCLARQLCLVPLLHLRPAKAPIKVLPSRLRKLTSLCQVVLAPRAEPLRPKMFVVLLSI